MRVKVGALLAFVVLSNAIGNFFLSMGMHHAAPGSLAAYFQPAVAGRHRAPDCVDSEPPLIFSA